MSIKYSQSQRQGSAHVGFDHMGIVWLVYSSDSLKKDINNSCVFSNPNSSQKLQSPPDEDLQRKDLGTFPQES